MQNFKQNIKHFILTFMVVMFCTSTHGIANHLEIGQIKPGMEMAERAQVVGQNAVINTGVRGALLAGTGENIGDIVRGEALSGGLALGQSVVGDVAVKKSMETGSVGKAAVHALAGTAYSSLTGASPLSGAIGGATSEIIAGIMESSAGINGPPSDQPLTDEQRHNLHNKIKAAAKLASATTIVI